MKKLLLVALSSTISVHALGGDTEIIVEAHQDGNNAEWFSQAVGKWGISEAKSKAPGLRSRKALYNEANTTGPASARFTPDIPVAGTYEVFATYPAGANASAVPYKVVSADGEKTITSDQNGRTPTAQPPSDAWFSLGSFKFSQGKAGYVEISDPLNGKRPFEREPNARVYADAVKFVPKDVRLPDSFVNKATGASATTVASAATPAIGAPPALPSMESAPAGTGLPPLPGAAGATGASASTLPSLPGSNTSAVAIPPLPGNSASSTLPALPGAAATGAASSSLPSLPGSAANANAAGAIPSLPGSATGSGSLPALPGAGATASTGASGASSLPSLPGAPASGGASAALPSLPGSAAAPATGALPSLPGSGASASTVPALPGGSTASATPASAAANLPGLSAAIATPAAAPALPGALPGMATPAPANTAALLGTPALPPGLNLPPINVPPAPVVGAEVPAGAPALPGALGLPGAPAGQPVLPGAPGLPGAPAGTAVAANDGSNLQWSFDYGAALNQARSTNKQVFVFFTAPGNRQVARYESEYFTNPAVRSLLDKYVMVKINFPQNTRLGYALGIYESGKIALTDPAGTKIGAIEAIPATPEDLVKALQAIK